MIPITVYLAPELLLRLETLAQLKQVSTEALVREVLDQHLPPADVKALEERRKKAWEEYQRLSAEDCEADDGYDLLKALDENRPEGQKLFPPELKGKSW
jgi:hypothetical protein